LGLLTCKIVSETTYNVSSGTLKLNPTILIAECSFTYNAPHIWNTLPADVTGNLNVTARTFKNKLKTFFYTNCRSYTIT